MQPPPSLDIAYNILLQDERQRQVNPSTQFSPESTSFIATSLNFSQPSHPQKQYPQRVSFDSNKAPQFCKYCKKSGHLIDKCYKLHGFPSGFRFTKGWKKAANAEVELVILMVLPQSQISPRSSMLNSFPYCSRVMWLIHLLLNPAWWHLQTLLVIFL